MLLHLLQSYGCLTTRQIASKAFPDVRLTTVLRRLRYLNEAGYIQKILGLKSSERLWAVTKKSSEKFGFTSAKTSFPRAILEHDSILATLRSSLEGHGIAQSWIPEHEIRQSVARRHGLRETTRRVIPDGIMSVEINGLKESVAVELELSPKNQKRYREILQDYSHKESLFAVWYVIQSMTLKKQIEQAEKSTYAGSRSPKILFSLIDDVLRDPLNAKVIQKIESRKISDLFTPKPAHPTAHVVSAKIEEKIESEIDATA
ncbi:MAG TPA: replication-relaxation family protein [Bdellovibrionales bacterium]|nr:replication-relaxation family protein [Bdellovibrionales bacterium]